MLKTKRKVKGSDHKKTRKKNKKFDWKTKYVIITADKQNKRLRRPLYSEYITKKDNIYTVKIPFEYFNTINNHMKVYKNRDLIDTLTQKIYKFFGKVNEKNDFIFDVSEDITRISSRWPEKLPSNLPFTPRIISKFDLGEPSIWRLARYVENPKTREVFFLKLVPKDLLLGIEEKDKLERIYKEFRNQEKSKSPYVLNIKWGQEEDTIWSLIEIAPNASLYDLKMSFPNKVLPEYIALYIFKQILIGLKAIHKAGVYHNWLQTRTILIDDKYNVKIGNFGESIDKNNYSEYDKFYFTKQLVSWPEMKTKMVLPPEWADEVEYNEKTDIWSAGIVFYQLLIESEEDKNNISNSTKDLILKVLEKDPTKRSSIDQLLNHKAFNNVSFTKELNIVSRDIKLWTFAKYFYEQYSKTFYFKKSTKKDFIENYIKEYLLTFTKPFCYDEYTGWNSILNKIWYHDQATVVYNMDYPNNIYITQFDTNKYFKINIKDLIKDSLPEKYLAYITNEKWKTFTEALQKTIKYSNKHYNNQDFKHFNYSDLEFNKEKTFESLPTKNLLENGKQFQLHGTKQVLSLLVKISKEQAKTLNDQGRITSQEEEFDGNSYYIPIELCDKDVVTNIMASALSEYLVCKKKFEESYCYITIRKSQISPSTKQGVAGWHVDGSWGEQTYRHQNYECNNGLYTGSFTDRNYIIQSAEEIKTPVAVVPLNLNHIRDEAMKKFHNGEITVLPADNFEDIILHKYLTHNVDYPPFQPPGLTTILDTAVEQSMKDNNKTIVELPANTLNYFTAYTIHNVPSNRTNKIINRETFRIAYSSDYFDKACGPTINPCIGIPGMLRFFPYPKPYSFSKNLNLISKLF